MSLSTKWELPYNALLSLMYELLGLACISVGLFCSAYIFRNLFLERVDYCGCVITKHSCLRIAVAYSKAVFCYGTV